MNTRETAQTSDIIKERAKEKSKTPKTYKVILLNDDYTTMEFVTSLLEGLFQKSPAEAFRLMMKIHTDGQAVCGAYTYEVAETKVALVYDNAQKEGFPLQAKLEEG
tara:strand:+ start:4212 stop:4529 length:318 start_codon:yes stop_codon:yes gene_type:complete